MISYLQIVALEDVDKGLLANVHNVLTAEHLPHSRHNTEMQCPSSNSRVRLDVLHARGAQLLEVECDSGLRLCSGIADEDEGDVVPGWPQTLFPL